MKKAVNKGLRSKWVWVLLAPLWIIVFVVGPAMTYFEGTSRDVSVRVIREPYVESSTLQYEWSGDVYRSCPISLRRTITDAANVVHFITPISFDAKPVSELGPQSVVLDVTIGPNLAEGPAVYQVLEVPQCSWMQRLRPVAIAYPPVEFNVTRPRG